MPTDDASTNGGFDPAGEIEELKKLAASVPMPAGLKEKVDKMLVRLSRMAQMGNYTKEYEPVEQYVKWVIQIPWGRLSKDNLDLKNVAEELNRFHFGLQTVKDKVVDYLAVLKLQIEGPPRLTSEQQAQLDANVAQKAVQAQNAAAIAAASNASHAVWPPPAVPTAVVPPAAAMPSTTAAAVQPTDQSQTGVPGAVTKPVEAGLQGASPEAVAVPVAQLSPAVPQTTSPAPQTGSSAQEMSKLQGSSAHAPIMCFVGIQGVGKTSIAKSIANALGRKFVRVSLGALGDVSQIRGIPKGELNAEPGQIVKALIRAGTMNPLILLDEIDKTSSESGLRADLMAALLEILDPEQNSTFVDHYLDYPVDLSQCMFITTSNNLGGLSAALLDRLEIIRFGSYTDEDKVQIARNYMLPRVREATGITEQQLSFDDEVWPMVVRPLGFDAGVRELERTLTNLARKVARLIVEGKGTGFRITKDNFHEFIPEDIGVYS